MGLAVNGSCPDGQRLIGGKFCAEPGSLSELIFEQAVNQKGQTERELEIVKSSTSTEGELGEKLTLPEEDKHLAEDKFFIILRNFYERKEGNKYQLSIFGKKAAGDDRKLTLDNILQFDTDGDKDLTQKEIDEYKANKN